MVYIVVKNTNNEVTRFICGTTGGELEVRPLVFRDETAAKEYIDKNLKQETYHLSKID